MAVQGGRPVEILEAVAARYGARRPVPRRRHWRREVPAASVPRGSALRIEDRGPFLLHLSFDGWRRTEDREAQEGAFGLWGVTVEAPGGTELVFTRRGPVGWDGEDFRVAFA